MDRSRWPQGTRGRKHFGPPPGGRGCRIPFQPSFTYIGNKRALLNNIAQAVERVKHRLGKERLRVFDVFAGSGVVSRLLKAHAPLLVSNDFEDYAAVVGRCYLRNRSTVDFQRLGQIVDDLNARVDSEPFPTGLIEELYAPKDEDRITAEDRVFYTRENARRLDNYRRMLDVGSGGPARNGLGAASQRGIDPRQHGRRVQGILQGPSHRCRAGSAGAMAMRSADSRPDPTGAAVLSRFECDVEVMQADANAAAREVRGLDLAYVDPPYNQHPYGSNYFMLNLLVHYQRPGRSARFRAFRRIGVDRATTRRRNRWICCGPAADARLPVSLGFVQRRRVHKARRDDGFTQATRFGSSG